MKVKEFISQFISLRSLRARIFIMVLLVGIVPSMLLRYGIVRNYEERAVQFSKENVQNQ